MGPTKTIVKIGFLHNLTKKKKKKSLLSSTWLEKAKAMFWMALVGLYD